MNIPGTTPSGRIADPPVQINPPSTLSSRSMPAAPVKPASAGSTAAPVKNAAAQELETELAAANHKLSSDGHEMRFEYDREANRLVVRLVDLGTREVLRQFPSDEALRAARQVKSGKPLMNMLA